MVNRNVGLTLSVRGSNSLSGPRGATLVSIVPVEILDAVHSYLLFCSA